jgi:hypothetical protein
VKAPLSQLFVPPRRAAEWGINMKKKRLSFALAAALLLAAGVLWAPPVFAVNLSDTAGHWAEGQILAGIDYGYINGYPDGSFKPDGTITRAEFVTIINKAKNYTAMTNIPFRDVPVNEWYFQEVQRAYNAAYIQGDSEGNFKPNAQITRQEVAVILNRIAPGGDVSYPLTGVHDADRIDSWALPAVKAAYSRGYITGDAEGNFNPLSPLKRGEAVTIVNRVLGVSPLTPGAELAALSISNINITDVKTDSALLNLTATRNGNVYWVVLTGENAATPDAAQVQNGRTADNQSPYGTGNRSVYANSAISAALSSLQAEQSYKVCAVARDAAGNLSPVAVRTFTTTVAGVEGEEWLGSNFTVSNIVNNAFTLTVNSSRTGTLYYVVVEDPNRNVKTPTQSYIRNGRDASNSSSNVISGNTGVSAGTSKLTEITGLKSGTNYKIFGCVYESTSSSLYSTVKNYVFTTTGTYVNWITNFDVQSIGATNATLNVRTDRAGTFYYVVTTESKQPNMNYIRNGRDYNNIGTINGSRTVSANTYDYPTLSNLAAGTTYYAFGVLYNGEYSEIETYRFVTGSGTASLLNQPINYVLRATAATGGAITFNNSGLTYTGTQSIDLRDSNSGAAVDITVSKSNAASSVRAELQRPSRGTVTLVTNSTNASFSFTINNNDFDSGTNTVRFTVEEQNKSSLTYTITVYK